MYNGHCAAAHAGIAQSVEHFTRNEGVVSSSLISGFHTDTHKKRDDLFMGVFVYAKADRVLRTGINGFTATKEV